MECLKKEANHTLFWIRNCFKSKPLSDFGCLGSISMKHVSLNDVKRHTLTPYWTTRKFKAYFFDIKQNHLCEYVIRTKSAAACNVTWSPHSPDLPKSNGILHNENQPNCKKPNNGPEFQGTIRTIPGHLLDIVTVFHRYICFIKIRK